MTDAPKNIIGSGGGSPPPPPQPTRTPDTLHSRQFATFLDLISEGEIEGFATPSANGVAIPTSLFSPLQNQVAEQTADEKEYLELAEQDVFLNGRAVRNASNQKVIIKTSMAIRTGKEGQEIMGGIETVRRSETLTPAIVRNNNDMEANKVTGTVAAGLTVEDTPEVVVVTLSWASLRQLHPFDGSSQGLIVTEGPVGDFAKTLVDPVKSPEAGAVHIFIKVLLADGVTEIGRREEGLAAISVGPYARDYQIPIPESYRNTPQKLIDNFPLQVEVRRKDVEFRSVFILPPSIEELRGRIEKRGLDSEDVIEKRMKNALKELGEAEEYDYLVINDVFEHAIEELLEMVINNDYIDHSRDKKLKILQDLLS